MAIDWLGIYLEEDLGEAGDLTSTPLLGPDAQGAAKVVAREAGVAAGIGHAMAVFERLGASPRPHQDDGDPIAAEDALITVDGSARAILAGERTALNIVGRMSGIATRTHGLMQTLRDAGCSAVVAGTRKTTPGFRAFEKEAISVGGGDPHRMGLHDAMMLKDNHIAAVGDVGEATRRLRAAHPRVPLEVEVESLEDGMAAAGAGADWILIDNQEPDMGARWASALRQAHTHIRIEASGGITEERLVEYGWADRISLGGLTHAVHLDVGLDWQA